MQLNFNFVKFLLPGVQQFHRVAAGDREQQFKILAIGERGGERRLVCRACNFAARETGIARFNNSAPTPLAFKMCRKSPARPSLKSIMA